MTPLVEFIALTGVPFLAGVAVGYSLRSYVSLVRRSKGLR